MLLHFYVLVALVYWCDLLVMLFDGHRGDGEDDDVQFDPNSFMQSMQKIFGLSLFS